MRDSIPTASSSVDRIAALSQMLRQLVEPSRPFSGTALGVYASVWRGKRFRALSVIVSSEGDSASLSLGSAVVRSLEGDPTVFTPEVLDRARRLREFIAEQGLSRFCDALCTDGLTVRSDETKPVVVVVELDAPLELLEPMLERAERDHPDAAIWLVPESESGLRLPEANAALLCKHPRARWLSNEIDRAKVLELAAEVYTGSAKLGFEALLRHLPVTVFGEPFYAGWGLTRDVQHVTRQRPSTLDELVAATLLLTPRYFDWVLGQPTAAEAAFEHLALQRRRFLENRGHFLCVGLSLWKRVVIARYLESKGNEVVFLNNATALAKVAPKPDTKVLVWASHPHDRVEAYAKEQALELWRMEDGFLRSVGLGSDWSAPGSLVFDPRGIYYDPRQPSQLEELLNSSEFSPRELEQAEELRRLILELRISKYNSTLDRPYRPRNRQGQRTILVPGQVADDASVRLGGTAVGSIDALLRATRKAEPDAHIIYKPHPDVLSGNRRGHIDEGRGVLFDELVLDVPIARCLEQVDAVHTLSSLVGFEALLRELPVTCHGQPFYAGWGLTQDTEPISRRKRALSLRELVAGTLMRYPRYYHFPSGDFCTAAQMVTALSNALNRGTPVAGYPKTLRKLQGLVALAKDLFNAG